MYPSSSTGNATLKLKSNDKVKVVTVRTTSFEAAASTGSAATENAPAAAASTLQGSAQFVGEELSKSDRPELTSAKTVVSGGAQRGWCLLYFFF